MQKVAKRSNFSEGNHSLKQNFPKKAKSLRETCWTGPPYQYHSWGLNYAISGTMGAGLPS